MGAFHSARLKVRDEETDASHVVHHSKYLGWFEIGRMNLLRDIGIPYRKWLEKRMNAPVVEAKTTYRIPAMADDEILVLTRVAKAGTWRLKFTNRVYRLPKKELLCTGYTVHVLTDANSKPERIPVEIATKLKKS